MSDQDISVILLFFGGVLCGVILAILVGFGLTTKQSTEVHSGKVHKRTDGR